MNKWQETTMDKLLLVAGTGRNSGKTSFITRICESWDLPDPLICIKISNHIHKLEGIKLVHSSARYSIYEETQTTNDKDTARMLLSGASRVFLIEAEKQFIYSAFLKLLEIIPLNAAIICESGTLRHFTKPSLFVMLHNTNHEPKESSKEIMHFADTILEFEEGSLELPIKPVEFVNNCWKLN